MVKAKDAAKIERLRNLATSPDAQLAYGLHLIETECLKQAPLSPRRSPAASGP